MALALAGRTHVLAPTPARPRPGSALSLHPEPRSHRASPERCDTYEMAPCALRQRERLRWPAGGLARPKTRSLLAQRIAGPSARVGDAWRCVSLPDTTATQAGVDQPTVGVGRSTRGWIKPPGWLNPPRAWINPPRGWIKPAGWIKPRGDWINPVGTGLIQRVV